MILTVLLFILILSVLVFVHELGHFLVARACGMHVEEFGFGFPPRAFGIRRGKTIYSINWIPIGGFVRIKGENGTDASDNDSFSSKKPWQRFLVLIAGVTMNFLLASVLLSIGFMVGLPTEIGSNIPAQANIRESRIAIMEVVSDSPAARAGIEQGDSIVLFDGRVIDDAEQARAYLVRRTEAGVDLVIQKRDASQKMVHVVAEPLKGTTMIGIGVGFIRTGLVSFPVHLAIVRGVSATYQMTGDILRAFSGLIVGLFSGQSMDASLSGPVGIAVMTGQVAAKGIVYLLQFAAILSINLGVINVLPFPALDGGRILFLAIEKLRGKAVNQRFEVAVNNLGFLLLMVLIMFVTVKDVMHLFT